MTKNYKMPEIGDVSEMMTQQKIYNTILNGKKLVLLGPTITDEFVQNLRNFLNPNKTSERFLFEEDIFEHIKIADLACCENITEKSLEFLYENCPNLQSFDIFLCPKVDENSEIFKRLKAKDNLTIETEETVRENYELEKLQTKIAENAAKIVQLESRNESLTDDDFDKLRSQPNTLVHRRREDYFLRFFSIMLKQQESGKIHNC